MYDVVYVLISYFKLTSYNGVIVYIADVDVIVVRVYESGVVCGVCVSVCVMDYDVCSS